MKIDDRWVLVAGLRRDKSSTSIEGTSPAQKDMATSVNIGGVWLAGDWSPYVNYSESFDPVSGTDAAGNLFKPQRGKQIEAGVKWQVTDGLAASGAVYELREKNRLATDPDNVAFSVQRGEVTVKGLELELAGQLASWDLTAQYTYTDAQVTQHRRHARGAGHTRPAARGHTEAQRRCVGGAPFRRGAGPARRLRRALRRRVHRRPRRWPRSARGDAVRRHGVVRDPRLALRAQREQPHRQDSTSRRASAAATVGTATAAACSPRSLTSSNPATADERPSRHLAHRRQPARRLRLRVGLRHAVHRAAAGGGHALRRRAARWRILLAFLVFLVCFCWAFAAASVARVWIVLAGGGALMTGARLVADPRAGLIARRSSRCSSPSASR